MHCHSSCHFLQAGLTLRSFDSKWENFEWDADDHMEELWRKGEAGFDLDSFSQSPLILEPDHFQCMFLIIGCIFSVQLIVLLWDILSSPRLGFFSLMFAGMFACLMITSVNLFFFSTSLWTPITYDTPDRKYNDSSVLFFYSRERVVSGRAITTGEYEYDWKTLVKNKAVAFAILGYGAVTSFIFIFFTTIRSLGKNDSK